VEHPREASPRKAPALPGSIGLCRKGLPGKNTTLLRKFVNFGQKMFHNIGPRLYAWPTSTLKTFNRQFQLKLCIIRLVCIPGNGNDLWFFFQPHQCTVCDPPRGFHTLKTLRDHMNIHTNERPYKWRRYKTLCSRQTKWQNKLECLPLATFFRA
jgi:hypothetical protein